MTQSSPPPDHALARRTILKGASLGIGAGLVSGLASTAQAQTTGPGRRRRRRAGLERRILGQEGRRQAQSLAQARRRAEAGRAAAAGAVPGARLVELHALVLRPHRAGQGRVLVHERDRALRLRRLDHGPRRLRPLRQLRQQLRHRQRRRGPQGRDPGGDAGDRAEQDAHVRHLVGRDPRRRLCAGRARARRPAGAGRLHLQGHRLAGDRRGGRRGSRSCAPTIAASATPP